ncbi:hypothetical protein C8Q80DRAFT_1186859 [Daedaleopsis nitida]|nr:hypothetical protein C8Q80DRAFT_1186859 [Daedaleopsis nitida]
MVSVALLSSCCLGVYMRSLLPCTFATLYAYISSASVSDRSTTCVCAARRNGLWFARREDTGKERAMRCIRELSSCLAALYDYISKRHVRRRELI